MEIHAVEDFLHDFSPDIFVIDVDAVGGGGGQLFFPIDMLVVDGRVEAELVRQPGALVVRSCDSYYAATVNLPDLPGYASGCAGCGGDDQSFAFLRLGDFGHAKIGG